MLSKITEQVRHILCQDRSKVSQTITQLSSQICATKSSVDQDRLEDQLRNKTLLLTRARKCENQHTILLCLRRHIQHLATFPHKGLLQQEANQEVEGTHLNISLYTFIEKTQYKPISKLIRIIAQNPIII